MHQHELTLLRRESRLEHGDLIGLGGRDAEPSRIAIEHESGHRVRRTAQPVELAPSQSIDRPRLFRSGMFLQQLNIGRRYLLGADPREHLLDGRTSWRRRGGNGRRLRGSRLTSGIGVVAGHAMINAIEIIKLRLSRAARGEHKNGADEPAKERGTMHRRHHSAKAGWMLPGLGLTLALTLSACAPYTRPDPPGFIGALLDRAPPPVVVRSNGPYPGPIAEPVSPIMTQQVADAVVAAPMSSSLSPEARMSMAEASMRAAAAPTGTTILWTTADGSGSVVPARDVYRSHRGEICRDLRQQVQTSQGPAMQQITLCRADRGDNLVLWLPGSPD